MPNRDQRSQQSNSSDLRSAGRNERSDLFDKAIDKNSKSQSNGSKGTQWDQTDRKSSDM